MNLWKTTRSVTPRYCLHLFAWICQILYFLSKWHWILDRKETHYLHCRVPQVAADGHTTSNIGHSVPQRAEHTTWKNELVRTIDLCSPLLLLLSSHYPNCISSLFCAWVCIITPVNLFKTWNSHQLFKNISCYDKLNWIPFNFQIYLL